MSFEGGLIIGILMLAMGVVLWWADYRQRRSTNKFFNEVLDNQIDQRGKRISEQSADTKETVDEYYKRMEAYARKHNVPPYGGRNSPDDRG